MVHEALEAATELSSDGWEIEIVAYTRNPRFANGQRFARQFFRLQMAVKKLVLAKNHRVVERDSFQQHRISVLDRRGRKHDEAGIMRINRLDTLTVKRPRFPMPQTILKR
jgi:hypothetical protein